MLFHIFSIITMTCAGYNKSDDLYLQVLGDLDLIPSR